MVEERGSSRIGEIRRRRRFFVPHLYPRESEREREVLHIYTHTYRAVVVVREREREREEREREIGIRYTHTVAVEPFIEREREVAFFIPYYLIYKRERSKFVVVG